MRTTLNIDDDVLDAAKYLARHSSRTTGQVVSDLLRRALTGSSAVSAPPAEAEAVLGFRPFPSRGVVVTNELIDRLRDEGPY